MILIQDPTLLWLNTLKTFIEVKQEDLSGDTFFTFYDANNKKIIFSTQIAYAYRFFWIESKDNYLKAQGLTYSPKEALFRIEKSPYVSLIQEESFDIYNNDPMDHLCLVVDNAVLDFITAPPYDKEFMREKEEK